MVPLHGRDGGSVRSNEKKNVRQPILSNHPNILAAKDSFEITIAAVMAGVADQAEESCPEVKAIHPWLRDDRTSQVSPYGRIWDVCFVRDDPTQ